MARFKLPLACYPYIFGFASFPIVIRSCQP